MAVSDDRVTFWFGCNMLRHAEMIRLSIMLLERAGCNVNAVGGPAYCCGTAHDHEPRASSTMAARTVGRFNEAAATDGRDKVVIWCPSCHMHMSDIMAPGNTTHFDIAHVSEILSDRAAQLAAVMTTPVRRRVLLHRHTGFANHVDVNGRVADVLSRIRGSSSSKDRPTPATCAVRWLRSPERWPPPLKGPGAPPLRTAATPSARSFIPAIANSRRSTARTTSVSATGSISSLNRWG
jgi:Fe-S oxidoreductase